MDWLNSRLNPAEERMRYYPKCSTKREGDRNHEREIKWLESTVRRSNINLIGVSE